MKKRNLIWVVFIGIVLFLAYLQFGRDVRVVSSMNISSDRYYEQKLTIVANKLFILNKDKFVEEMLQRCIDNDFHEMKFSYDLNGYPDKIEITVYLNEIALLCVQCIQMIIYPSCTAIKSLLHRQIILDRT